MDAKVGVNTRRIIGVQDELAAKLQTGMNTIAFALEVVPHNPNTLFPCRRVQHDFRVGCEERALSIHIGLRVVL